MVPGGCGPRHAASRVHMHTCVCPGLCENPHEGPTGAASVSECGVSECGSRVVEGAPWGLGQVTARASWAQDGQEPPRQF